MIERIIESLTNLGYLGFAAAIVGVILGSAVYFASGKR